MDLAKLTCGRYIRIGLSASRKESAIELLLDCLTEGGAVPAESREQVLKAVLQRERRLSTGLEAGIAIPHGTTSCIAEEVAALGVFPGGVPFETVDDRKPQIVILLITPLAKRHRHVTNLASIARQLLRPELRLALLEASTTDEALEAIRSQARESC